MKLGVRNFIINIVPIILFYIEILVLSFPKYSLLLLLINLILIIITSTLLDKYNNVFTLVEEQIPIDIMSIFINFFLISGIYIYLHGNGTTISYSNSLIFLIINLLNIFNYLLRVSDNNSIINIKNKGSLLVILINFIPNIVIYLPIFNTTKLYFKEIITSLILSYAFVCWYDVLKRVRRRKYDQKEKKN